MSDDYIKREDAIERLSYHADFYQNDREFGGEEMLYKDSALNEISELPSADVVEVVRCKDCKYWKDSDGVYRRGFDAESKCPLNLKEVYEGTFYCGFGERADT